MDAEFLQTIITGAPNFFGFILALLLLMRIIGKQYELIILLIGKWENCEESEEKSRLVSQAKVPIKSDY